MRIESGVTTRYIYFVAVDATDFTTRETGLSSFTVYRSRNGGAAAAMTTPTINETDATNMPGVYELLLDEDMTIGSGNDSEEMAFHITHAGMAPVTRTIELYRPKITAGNTLSVESDGDLTEVNTLTGHTAQTGDSYARLGAPAGASVSADIATVDGNVDTILVDTGTTIPGVLGTPTDFGSGTSTLAANLQDMADNGTATFDRSTDSLQAIRDRGDSAWTTGGGGSLTQAINVTPQIPFGIDLANTKSYRLGLLLVNSVDDLPSTAEITPGTIDIDRAQPGATSWTSVVAGAACSEAAGLVYYDEVFDSGTGYQEGDLLRITFYSQSVTADANTHEISDATEGRTFYTGIVAAEPNVNVSSWNGTALSTTNPLPNAAAGANGGLPTVDASNYLAGIQGTINTLDALDTAQDTQHSTTQSSISGLNDPTAATIADAVWDETQSTHTTAGTFGELATEIASILADTNELQTDDVPGLIAALNDISAADVNAQVLDVLNTDTFGEPTGVPAATATLVTKLGYLYMALRNQIDVTATKKTFYDDGGSAEWEKDLSDDGTTYSESEANAI